MGRALVVLLMLVLVTMLGVIWTSNIASAASLPGDFQMPFKCGQTWKVATYQGHGSVYSNGYYAQDWNNDNGDAWEMGQPVLASADGTVRRSVYLSVGGNYIEIDHGGGWLTTYAHLQNRLVSQGQSVSRGTQIGTVGNSGGVPTHLHYEQVLNGVVQPGVFNGQKIVYSEVYNGNPYTSQNCAPAYAAAFHSQSAGAVVAQGDTGTLNFRFTNTGSATWRRDQGVNLGTVNPDTNEQDYWSPFYNPSTWVSPVRPAALAEDSVAPGQVGTFDIRVYVPPTMAPGTYTFRVRPVADGVAWMEPTSMGVWLPITVVPRQGWHVEYFSGTDLSWSCANGYEDTAYVFKQWGGSAPGGGCPADQFSARFTKVTNFTGGRYNFHVDHDDGARMYLDDKPLIDSWADCSFCPSDASVDVSAGNHVVRVEYYENGGAADLAAWWSGPGALPAKQAVNTTQWYGEYWGNNALMGVPAVARNEGTGALSRNYGGGGPGYGLPADNFSARVCYGLLRRGAA